MSISKENRRVLLAGLLLGTAATIGTGLLAVTNTHSTPYIENNKKNARLELLQAVMPTTYFDNVITTDTIEVMDTNYLALSSPSDVFRGRLSDRPSAIAFRLIAPDGYTEAIELLMAVSIAGEVLGVRVLSHRETPGLGDKIDIHKSDWMLEFEKKSLANTEDAMWQVKKDGGSFDHITGATITSRAVIKAVKNGLEFSTRYQAQLFEDITPPELSSVIER